MRTLVLGGIRSGKSRWAQQAITDAVAPADPVRYIATGAAADTDPAWTQRVVRHRAERPDHWRTVETSDVAAQLRDCAEATLVDDLGGWLTAALDRRNAWEDPEADVSDDVDELCSAVDGFDRPLVMVSPEVGLTVVPATAAGRRFADDLGTLNQRLARVCAQVVLVVAGQALTVKGEQR